MKKNIHLIMFLCGILILFSSCLSQGVKKVSLDYAESEGLVVAKVDKKDYGTIYISGIVNSAGSGSKFEVVSLYWFNNWAEGWSEVRFAASGSLDISGDEINPQAFIATPIDLIAIEDVKIRYRDTIIEHDTALRQFQGRSDRIQAAVDVLRENGSLFWANEAAITYPRYELRGPQRNEGFVAVVQRFFFPELFGFVEPYGPSNKEDLVRSDEYYWDTAYTKNVFPEHFHEVRNSGTIYRDWVESKHYFYFLYMFDEFIGNKAVGKVLPLKIK